MERIKPSMQRQATWEAIFKPGMAEDFFEPAPPGSFDPSAAAFSSVNAWWLSELSRLVYRRDAGETSAERRLSSRNEILAHVGLREQATFFRYGIFASLVLSGDHAAPPFGVLVFRGSTGRLDNWMANFDTRPQPWPPGGRVHAGFKAALLGIWPEILEALRRLKQPVFYTGHSLGAALATLAASLRPPRAVYTFGSPRVGNGGFARLMEAIPVYRLAGPRDIVTRMPPAIFPFGYRHVGLALPLGTQCRPGRQPLSGTDMDLDPAAQSTGWPRSLDRLGQPPVFLADHAPVRYTDALAI
jgi:triacylglycerol lipase